MAHHYVESGLENVYLENGYQIHQTAYGEGLSIENVAGLHRAIALWLVALPSPLTGADLRFLRTEMELTQRNLAGIIGATEQTLRLWEKGRKKAIPGPADRLLRAFYYECVTGDGSVRRLVERMANLDQVSPVNVRLRETPSGWQVEARAA